MPGRLLITTCLAAASLALPAARPVSVEGQRQGSAPSPGIHTLATSAGFADLQFLKPLLAGVRIVQLGENGHGSGEATTVRARLVRFLHEELGFTVLAFESSLYLSHRGDRRLVQIPPRSTLLGSLLGVWHTEEMLPLVAYLHDSRPTPSPMKLAGFDVQPIGTAKRERPRFFADLIAPIDPAYAKDVLELDTTFVAELDKGPASRRDYLRSRGTALAADYRRLADFLDRHRDAVERTAGREAPLVAAQEARSMVAYVTSQASPDRKDAAEARDRGMADNVAFLAERLYPGEKIVVWGHNYHLRHANADIPPQVDVFPGVAARSMGTWVREHFGKSVYTIGQYEFEGRSLDNGRNPYDIPAAAPGSLEHRLAAPGAAIAFLDVRTTAKTPGFGWLDEPVSARYNGQHEQRLVPSAQYDGLLLIRRVSPATYLY